MPSHNAFTRITRAQRNEILAARQQGIPLRKCAAIFGVSQPSIIRWEREARGELPPTLAADELIGATKPKSRPAPLIEDDCTPEPDDVQEFRRSVREALTARDERNRTLPRWSLNLDLLGEPPPGRSALDRKLAAMGVGP